jgi:hypothetical protein
MISASIPHLEKPSGGETKIDVSVGRVQRIQLVVPDAGGGLKDSCVCVCLLVCFGFFFLGRPGTTITAAGILCGRPRISVSDGCETAFPVNYFGHPFWRKK